MVNFTSECKDGSWINMINCTFGGCNRIYENVHQNVQVYISYQQWKCYDNKKAQVARDYEHFYIENSKGNCNYVCNSRDYPYAYVENGNDCFCSYEYPSEEYLLDKSECNVQCPGYAGGAQYCGGVDKVEAYKTFSPMGSEFEFECKNSIKNFVVNESIILDTTLKMDCHFG